MEKASKDSENKITLKDFINWIVILLIPVIPSIITRLFDSNKDNDILTKFFLVSLITSSFITFVWIKIFSSKKDNKLVNRLIKEVETKKDLEKQKENLERSLKFEQMLRSHAEKDKDKLEKENKKLVNENNQLTIVLSRCGILRKEVGIDENISSHEWEKKPGIKKNRGNNTKRLQEMTRSRTHYL